MSDAGSLGKQNPMTRRIVIWGVFFAAVGAIIGVQILQHPSLLHLAWVEPVPAKGLFTTSFHRGPNLRSVPLSERLPPSNSRDREEIELQANVGGTFTFAVQTDATNPVCAAGPAAYELPRIEHEWKSGLKLGQIAGSMGDGTALGSQRMPDCVRLTITRLEDGAVQTQDFHFDTLP